MNPKALITAANALRRLTQSAEEKNFWVGYLRGVRRAEHGEKFGTEDDHRLWLALADDIMPDRRARGLGYRAGLKLIPPIEAIKTLFQTTLPHLTCTRCGHSWTPRTGKPPRNCPGCNSPYWDKARKEKGRG